jgi:hypothetical protein
MDVLYERVAGLDVHKDTVVACVRIVADGKTKRECRTFAGYDGAACGAASVAGRLPVQARGDGSDGRLLDAGVADPGRGRL